MCLEYLLLVQSYHARAGWKCPVKAFHCPFQLQDSTMGWRLHSTTVFVCFSQKWSYMVCLQTWLPRYSSVKSQSTIIWTKRARLRCTQQATAEIQNFKHFWQNFCSSSKYSGRPSSCCSPEHIFHITGCPLVWKLHILPHLQKKSKQPAVPWNILDL